LAEDLLNEIGIPDSMAVLGGELQVDGQGLVIGEQGFLRRRIGHRVPSSCLGDPVTAEFDEAAAGLDAGVFGTEELPEGIQQREGSA
jgi:hypothetical protein